MVPALLNLHRIFFKFFGVVLGVPTGAFCLSLGSPQCKDIKAYILMNFESK